MYNSLLAQMWCLWHTNQVCVAGIHTAEGGRHLLWPMRPNRLHHADA